MVPTLAAVLSDPLGSWPVWEVALAAAALAVGGAAAAVGLAWRALLLKRAAAAEFAGDETGAGALGAALGSAHPWIDAGTIAEVWAAHAALPADRRRELALAVVGLVRGSGPATWYALRESIKSAVRGFVPKARADAPARPLVGGAEPLPSALGRLLAFLGPVAEEDTLRALADASAELPPAHGTALVFGLTWFFGFQPADELDELDELLIEVIAAFRAAPPPNEPPDSTVAAAFGELLACCGGTARRETLRTVWEAFARLPSGRRAELVATLRGLTAGGNPPAEPDAQLLAVCAAFGAPTPEPAGTP